MARATTHMGADPANRHRYTLAGCGARGDLQRDPGHYRRAGDCGRACAGPRGARPVFLLAAVAGTGAMLAASAQSALLPFAIAYAGGCGLVGPSALTKSRRRPRRARGARARDRLADALRRLLQPHLPPADRLARRIGRVAERDPDPGRHGPGRVRAGSRPGQQSRWLRPGGFRSPG